MPSLEFAAAEFYHTRKQAEELYRTFKQIKCPYFQDVVHFNTKGLRHISFKGWNRGRDQHDQFMRLKYITRAPAILGMSHTVQGIFETKENQRRQQSGRWKKNLVPVTYYEFIAVLSNRRFKVIVKQFEGGHRIFWSLIPFWRKTREGKRLLHNGDPAKD